VFLGILLWLPHDAAGQSTPAITSINPPSVAAGAATFTLTVNGSGYQANSVVQVNGSNRPTIFRSGLQITATIFATDIITPATLQITVFNPFAVGGGLTSNAVPLLVATAPAPSLISSSPQFSSQAANRIQMTLVGANFRPGATVVISPPLQSVSQSNGHTRATDIAVFSTTVVNGGLMTAIVSLSPTATLGLRAVDVLNLDGTSTGTSANGAPGTSQPIYVRSSNSLGAPVSVVNIALLHPRNGTVVAVGQELGAEAILAGTGTGTVIGQWVWDGNVVEQFSASIVGGQSTPIALHQSLPTWFLGGHTLQLRIVQPNQIATKPVVIAVTPGNWKLQQLVQPAYGAAFASDPPRLLWAPVPGAAKYQVGFSTEPYVSGVHRWFDVVENEWQVPAQIWSALAEGELFWTVRTVESSGVLRKPLPMRSIYRLPGGSLAPTHANPAKTPAGHTLLEWNPPLAHSFYYVVISTDPDGKHPLRQYFTADPKLDLRAIDGKLTPGTTYYWRVDAIGPTGKFVLSGSSQSFVAEAVPHAALAGNENLIQLASLRRPTALPRIPDLASQISSQTPPANSSVSDLKPTISASFQTPVNPADVSLMLDQIDVTSIAQVSETKVAFTPPLELAGGNHDVNLTVGNEAVSWKFIEAGAAPPLVLSVPTTPAAAMQAGTDAEAPPAVLGAWPTPAAVAAAHSSPAPVIAKPTTSTPAHKAPSEEGQITSTTQWASGSNPPDSNTFSVSERMMYENGPWKFNVNGSGVLNSILNPEVQRTSHGLVNDYVFELGYKGDGWGANLRFGTVSPVLYTDAQFVTAATPRQGVEATLSTPAGKFGYFVNTNDEALGGGAGINFHQKMMGASWQAPLPKWAMFRLMWLSAQDTGAATAVGFDSMGNPIILPNPVASEARGDVYGALLNLHLTQKWLLSSEYAFSRENPNTADPTSRSEFGRAWRTGISGQTGKTNMNVAYRDVSENFGNPANPSLTQSSQPNLRGVDSGITETTHAGTFGLTYTFLENNVHPTTTAELLMHNFDETWSKQVDPKTNLVVDARQSLTQTGSVPASLMGQPPEQTGAQDQRDISGNLNLSRQVGTTTLTAGGTRDWNHNNLFPSADTITSSLNFGTNWVTKGFFQLNSQVSANWVAADGMTTGTTRNITLYVQPAFVWKKPTLNISPLLSIMKGRTILANGSLTSDTLTGQYGGRISWTLPGVLKFSTFSAQGSYNQNRNNIMGFDQRSTQLLVLWTATWGHKRTF
jgi:hypothetical protein